MGFVSTRFALENRLCSPIIRACVAALGAFAARILRINVDQFRAVPFCLVRELSPELAPCLLQNHTIQTRLCSDTRPGLLECALRGASHILDREVLENDRRMRLGETRRRLMHGVFATIKSTLTEPPHTTLRFLRVT